MSRIVCEAVPPHVHRFPGARPNGIDLVVGDIAQCDCGQYAQWSIGYVTVRGYWEKITKRAAKRAMRRAGCE